MANSPIDIKTSSKYNVVRYLDNECVDYTLDEGSDVTTVNILDVDDELLEKIIDGVNELDVG